MDSDTPAGGSLVDRPLVIAHRGASGHLPEHTLAAYWMAIEMGADYIEPDLVSTQDGVLVARHENAIAVVDAAGQVLEATTDVAEHAGFASRLTTRSIDGVPLTGWFTEDFTLAELKTLRARERLPTLRPGNARFDRMFEIPTFDEILDLVDQANVRRKAAAARRGERVAQPIGVYPETKHPTYFRARGLPLEEPLVQALDRRGLCGRDAAVFIQSFEVGNLKALRRMTGVPLIQLMNDSGQPWDLTLTGDPRSYADMATAAGLADVARYADGIGPAANLVVPRMPDGRLSPPSALVADAHALELRVHPFTFRAENNFLPAEFVRGEDPSALGDLASWLQVVLRLGVDGFFTDHTWLGRQVRDAFVAAH